MEIKDKARGSIGKTPAAVYTVVALAAAKRSDAPPGGYEWVLA